MRTGQLAASLAVAVALAGCGSSSGSGTSTTVPAGSTSSTTEAPLPAGPLPAKVTKMVCDDEAQEKIAKELGARATVAPPTWDVADHLYSCTFSYPTGSFTLQVKEESSWSQTRAYFASLGRELGDTDSLGNLGQGAFVTRDGSVVVRKDWKILLVDVAKLPPHLGKPPATPAGVAYSVADLILGCWDGD